MVYHRHMVANAPDYIHFVGNQQNGDFKSLMDIPKQLQDTPG